MHGWGHQSLRFRGLSLLEVMLALGLVSTAVLAIMSVYTMGLRQSAKAEKVVKATEMAREVLENTAALGFDKLPDTDRVFDGRVDAPQLNGFPPAPYPARDGLEAYVIVDQLGPELRSVCVKVYFEKEHSVVFQTYYKP